MSVTFSIDSRPTGKYSARCFANDIYLGTYDSREEAASASQDHEKRCRDCSMYGVDVSICWDAPSDFDVNMSNTNAAIILDILNYDDEELFGIDSADAFLGNVLLALAQDRHDAAVSDVVEVGVGGPTVIHCGTPSGYTNDRLAALADLATRAQSMGRKVVWG